MIYNDVYLVFVGYCYLQILGLNVCEGWCEVVDFNDYVMWVGLVGGMLVYCDQELMLYCKGYLEQVWMNLDYFFVVDEQGKFVGVIVIVVEIIECVLVEWCNCQEFQCL